MVAGLAKKGRFFGQLLTIPQWGVDSPTEKPVLAKSRQKLATEIIEASVAGDEPELARLAARIDRVVAKSGADLQIEYLSCLVLVEQGKPFEALEKLNHLSNQDGLTASDLTLVKELRKRCLVRIMRLPAETQHPILEATLDSFRHLDADAGEPLLGHDGVLAAGAVAVFPSDRKVAIPAIYQCFLIAVKDPDTGLVAATHFHHMNHAGALETLFDVFGTRSENSAKLEVKLFGGGGEGIGHENAGRILFNYLAERKDIEVTAATFDLADRPVSVVLDGDQLTLREGTISDWPRNALLQMETEVIDVRGVPLATQLDLRHSADLSPIFIDPLRLERLREQIENPGVCGDLFAVREAAGRQLLAQEVSNVIDAMAETTSISRSTLSQAVESAGIYIGDGAAEVNAGLVDALSQRDQSTLTFRFAEQYIDPPRRRGLFLPGSARLGASAKRNRCLGQLG